jgi:hypothetical protein
VLVPEPFVLVALIAAIRRILVMTGVLVTCLVGLRKRDKEGVAERA